jgi:hypothetical protein
MARTRSDFVEAPDANAIGSRGDLVKDFDEKEPSLDEDPASADRRYEKDRDETTLRLEG